MYCYKETVCTVRYAGKKKGKLALLLLDLPKLIKVHNASKSSKKVIELTLH